MRRARSLLVGSLPLLAALSLGLASEIPPLARNAEGGPFSPGDGARESSEVPSALPFDPPLGPEHRQDPGPAGPEPRIGDCWIAAQWTETIHGVPHLCTKWECSDGRSWTECAPL
ncbi:MAG: hypothetical protein ACREIU_04940 [Planctomycetota bacterium]